MCKELVRIRSVKGIEDVFTDSKVISDKTGYKHNSITKVLRRYKEDFLDFGPMDTVTIGKNGTVGYCKVYLLNEMQSTLLTTYLENNEKVRTFKKNLVKSFFIMREALREKQSSEWKKTRIKGKLTRKNETDAISQHLIPLAIDQGSKNSGMLYTVYSKLVNNSIGIPPKSREFATWRVLNTIETMETLIEKVIEEESKKGTYYKDIYKICKGKCSLLAELSCLPERKLLR